MSKRVYIFAPAHNVSGGPEALHQLRYYMEQQRIDAWIVYIDEKRANAEGLIPPRYEQYYPYQKKCICESEYQDKNENLIIMPEHYSFKLFNYKKSNKCIWWLGVFGYDGIKFIPDKNKIQKFHPVIRMLKYIKYEWQYISCCFKSWILYYIKGVKNYCASQFAYDYVTKTKKQKAYMLVEPISKEFLDVGMVQNNILLNQRKKIVLYNPSKPSALMNELLKRSKFEFVPIKGYTPDEMIELYRSATLYVDFGIFPGPERMPKEAVYNGCNILVAKHNASVNDFDVAIPKKYKLEDALDIENVERVIENMLENYENQNSDFDNFRIKIEGLEEKFEKDIKELFKDYIRKEEADV